jgi:hypothetical protein
MYLRDEYRMAEVRKIAEVKKMGILSESAKKALSKLPSAEVVDLMDEIMGITKSDNFGPGNFSVHFRPEDMTDETLKQMITSVPRDQLITVLKTQGIITK